MTQETGLIRWDDNGLPIFLGDSWEAHISSWLEVSLQAKQDRVLLASIAYSLASKWARRKTGKTVEQFAGDVGLRARTIYDYIQVYEMLQKCDQSQIRNLLESPLSFKHLILASDIKDEAEREAALAEAEDENLSAESMRDRQKKKRRKARIDEGLKSIASTALSDRYKLIKCDIREAHKKIAAQSIDVIITDPPYPQEYIPLYEDLAKLAAHALKPGASMLAMVGQSYLPEILSLMTPHMRYHWAVAYLTPGAHTQLWQREVMTGWKPVLWFTNGDYQGEWKYDVAKSEKPDKEHHEWGQSESGMADLIERFSYPGDTILDPFLGGGTTGVVALRMNRCFIGIDDDPEAIDTTTKRIAA